MKEATRTSLYARALPLLLFFMLQAFAGPSSGAPDTETLWQAAAGSAAGSQVTPQPPMPFAPDRYARFRLDESRMRAALTEASSLAGRGIAGVPLPMPDGEMLEFTVEETAVLPADLAARYPNIKTFIASARQGAIRGRLDMTGHGFHALLHTEHGMVLIDPRPDADGGRSYLSYYKHDYHPTSKQDRGITCHVGDAQHPRRDLQASLAGQHVASALAQRSGDQLVTYRLAVAATGEYTAYHGGTIADALGAIVTTINRVNSVYERDFAVRLQLVGNNDAIIYTNGATDPYTNNDGYLMLGENQGNLDAVIQSANYDIGHVFSTGGGGIAYLESVCSADHKAGGVTGSNAPVGDAFDIDYVAHEMGHQFGGNHTFNGTTWACGGGNRNADTAWEPGSGSTVMAYAGICGAEDLQPHSDSLFHAGSIAEMMSFVTAGGGAACGQRAIIANALPVANAGADYTIPANTPFVLTGSATDSDGDALTYTWDEMDLGAATPATPADDGKRPLFRSFDPASTPVRHFPRLQAILANTGDIGEQLPTTSRKLNFRLTARDQRGGVADDDMQITVDAGAGPFRVTSPNGGETVQGGATVTWNVANTTAAPVNCSQVDIALSSDGGLTFSLPLADNTTNDGSEFVSFPAGSTGTARLRIQCSDNIFFDISDNNFTLDNAAPAVDGSCGSASGQPAIAEPAANLCSAGTPSLVSSSPSSYYWTCAGLNGGASASCSAARAYLVTAASAGNGTISPGSRTVVYGSTTTFTLSPAAGYTATATGCNGTLSGTTYTTGAITAACTVYANFAPTVTMLSNGVPVTSLSGASGSWRYYAISVPGGASNLVISTSGGSGNLNLHVKAGSLPSDASYDCRPFLAGNAETCMFPATPTATTYYIGIHGYTSYASATLTASYASPGVLSLNAGTASIKENAGLVSLSVTRTAGTTGPASVTYATADGSALAGADYTTTTGQLTWSNGEGGSKTITVAIHNDQVREGSESFTVILSNPSGATLGSPSNATVTINDDEGRFPIEILLMLLE
jgi:hypothetical protein